MKLVGSLGVEAGDAVGLRGLGKALAAVASALEPGTSVSSRMDLLRPSSFSLLLVGLHKVAHPKWGAAFCFSRSQPHLGI